MTVEVQKYDGDMERANWVRQDDVVDCGEAVDAGYNNLGREE